MAWPLHELACISVDRLPVRLRVIADKLEPEDMVRTIMRLAGVAGVLGVAACGGSNTAMQDDLRKDLELASAASEISLSASQPAAQVVSAIERTTPPALRRVAQSQRVPKHRAAPRGVPAPVEVETRSDVSDIEPQLSEPAPDPSEVAPIPSPRPRPVASDGGGAGDDGIGTGRGGVGGGMGGIITVVLRGGVVDGDECDPRTDGRGRGRGRVQIAVNNRIPIVGTFPGSGRMGGTAATVGMILGGRSRF